VSPLETRQTDLFFILGLGWKVRGRSKPDVGFHLLVWDGWSNQRVEKELSEKGRMVHELISLNLIYQGMSRGEAGESTSYISS